jgi:hypothetical protein
MTAGSLWGRQVGRAVTRGRGNTSSDPDDNREFIGSGPRYETLPRTRGLGSDESRGGTALWTG